MAEKVGNTRKAVVDCLVTVTMNPLELTLFRRALAKAADEGLLHRTYALKRICVLDALRWDAEEKAEQPANQIRRVA